MITITGNCNSPARMTKKADKIKKPDNLYLKIKSPLYRLAIHRKLNKRKRKNEKKYKLDKKFNNGNNFY